MKITVDNYYDAQALIKILVDNNYKNVDFVTKGKKYIVTFEEVD